MSDQANNPYASPTSDHRSAASAAGDYGLPKRPISPKVFGILSIVFALIGVAGGIVNLLFNFNSPQQQEIMNQLGYSMRYMVISQAVGFFFALCLMWIGIALVKYKNAGRIGFNIYAWLTIVSTIAHSIYAAVMLFRLVETDDPMSNAIIVGGLIGGIVGSAVSLLFPVLGLIFLNRETVRQSLA